LPAWMTRQQQQQDPADAVTAGAAASSNAAEDSKNSTYNNDHRFGNIDDWPKKGFRLFVGNLSNEVNDGDLYEHFARGYPSMQRARIIRDPKKDGASKGYGFVLFGDPIEFARAKRELDQSWLGGRPIRIKKYQKPPESDEPAHRQWKKKKKKKKRDE